MTFLDKIFLGKLIILFIIFIIIKVIIELIKIYNYNARQKQIHKKEVERLISQLKKEWNELCLKNVNSEDKNSWINQQKSIYPYTETLKFLELLKFELFKIKTNEKKEEW